MMQRREFTLKSLSDSKTQEEMENEKVSLFNALNLGVLGLAAFPHDYPCCKIPLK